MVTAIILAAGESSRFQGAHKLFVPVCGKPLLYYSLQAIHDHPEIREVYMVASASTKKEVQNMVKEFHFPKVKKIILGGKHRQESFMKGFHALQSAKEKDIVVVHNGANPLVTEKEITEAIEAAQKYKASAVGKKIVDTVKEIKNGNIIQTHDRQKLVAAQTPQAAQYGLLKKALLKAEKEKKVFTDEAGMIENLGEKVKYIEASKNNFKVTTVEDYRQVKNIMGDVPDQFLVGIGLDSHEFETKKLGLTLGGVFIKNELKLKADSDGDVLLHALCNAILQALGEKSVGYFATPLFKEKNIKDSTIYLKDILKKLKKSGYHLNNIGMMIEGKKPKIDELSVRIKTSLSRLTGVNAEKIGITATTGKNLTSFGKGKGIQCFAIVSLMRPKGLLSSNVRKRSERTHLK